MPCWHTPDRDEVPEPFCHLCLVDEQVLAVQPVVHKLLAGETLRLGDLVLVVREDVVHAAVWMSKCSPRGFMDMAEHSMCQLRSALAQRGFPENLPVLFVPGLP